MYSHRYRLYLNRRDVRRQAQLVRQIRGRKFISGPQGEHYNLDEIFERLNRQYFDGLMGRPQLGWSRGTSRSMLGHFDPSHNAIIISRIFDQKGAPALALEYVMFHEMLHLQYPGGSHRHAAPGAHEGVPRGGEEVPALERSEGSAEAAVTRGASCYDPRLRIVVGISGASGVVYGMRLLERLRAQPAVEIHLILTRSGEKTLYIETGQTAADARKLAALLLFGGRYRIAPGQRVIPHRRDGDCAVLDPYDVRDRGGDQLQPAGPRGRHRAEGKAPVDSDGPGKPFSSGTPAQHDGAGGNGRDHRAAHSGVLQPAARP